MQARCYTYKSVAVIHSRISGLWLIADEKQVYLPRFRTSAQALEWCKIAIK
jgi:hypothetical protein